MKDFWLSCGHHLLDRDADGLLPVTDAFLQAYERIAEFRAEGTFQAWVRKIAARHGRRQHDIHARYALHSEDH